jgi:hypothetical protein
MKRLLLGFLLILSRLFVHTFPRSSSSLERGRKMPDRLGFATPSTEHSCAQRLRTTDSNLAEILARLFWADCVPVAGSGIGIAEDRDPPIIFVMGIICLELQPGQSRSVSLISSQFTHNTARSNAIIAVHRVALVSVGTVFIDVFLLLRSFASPFVGSFLPRAADRRKLIYSGRSRLSLLPC